MSQTRKTRADLGGWGLKAEKHWRKHRPNVVKSLEATGELYDALAEAEESAEAMYDQLWKQGMSPLEAVPMVERELLILPDDPSDQSSMLPEQTIDSETPA